MAIIIMKKEYDFYKGERGEFYNPDVKMNLANYLESDIEEFCPKYLEEKRYLKRINAYKQLRRRIIIKYEPFCKLFNFT